MRILGIESAVGSMLYPFLERGHEVVASYDSRGIGNAKNFALNFPGAEWLGDIADTSKYKGVDVVMSQPSCSKFSTLSQKDKSEYDKCIDINSAINDIKPKFHFIESKLGYLDEFIPVPGYSYHFEWVSNHHYGNPQRTRNRLWIMGIRDDISWKFMSNEKTCTHTVANAIAEYGPEDDESIDHVHVYKPFLKNSITKEYLSLDEAFDMLQRYGRLTYIAEDGQTKSRINRNLLGPHTCTTITGGGTWFHWDKKYPLTLREKAAIQGFPTEFSFKELSNTKKDKAVGKSMPLQFTRELVRQLEGIYPDKRSKVVPTPVSLSIFKRINKDKTWMSKQ